MILRSSESDTNNSNNFLLKLSLGKYGVLRTYIHLIFAVLFIIAVMYISEFAQWNAWGVAIAVFIYGVYITNIGLGLWRASRKMKHEVGSFFTKIIAALSVLAGIGSIINALKLLLTYF